MDMRSIETAFDLSQRPPSVSQNNSQILTCHNIIIIIMAAKSYHCPICIRGKSVSVSQFTATSSILLGWSQNYCHHPSAPQNINPPYQPLFHLSQKNKEVKPADLMKKQAQDLQQAKAKPNMNDPVKIPQQQVGLKQVHIPQAKASHQLSKPDSILPNTAPEKDLGKIIIQQIKNLTSEDQLGSVPFKKKRKKRPDEVRKYVGQNLSGQTRYLSNTAFRDFFGKQCMENYGRNYTRTNIGGLCYGDYLKSHNINPHLLQQPQNYQSFNNALMFAKRVIAKPDFEQWRRLVLKISTKVGKNEDETKTIIKRLLNNCNEQTKKRLIKEIRYILKQYHGHKCVFSKKVETLDRHIEKYQQSNLARLKEEQMKKSWYMIEDGKSQVLKHICHRYVDDQYKFKGSERKSVLLKQQIK